jgi:hypothetical protein
MGERKFEKAPYGSADSIRQFLDNKECIFFPRVFELSEFIFKR